MSPEFLITAMVVVLIPGAGALFTVSVGLSGGWRQSLVAAAGCTLGIVPHLVASLLGLAAVLQASAELFTVLKWLGVAYLLYLGWSTARSRGGLKVTEAPVRSSGWKTVGQAILLNLLNPKLTLFFFAFLPPFLHPERGAVWEQMLNLSAVFMGLTAVVFSLYGILAHRVRTVFQKSPRLVRRINKVFAGLFAALGIELAVSHR